MYRWTALVTLLAMAVYFFMSFAVGRARGRTGLRAPATTGHPDFERAFRVHMNTLEWMPLFLPLLWMTAFYLDDRPAALLGLVWVIGRVLYMRAYLADPTTRGTGFVVQGAATLLLFLAALAGVVLTIALP